MRFVFSIFFLVAVCSSFTLAQPAPGGNQPTRLTPEQQEIHDAKMKMRSTVKDEIKKVKFPCPELLKTRKLPQIIFAQEKNHRDPLCIDNKCIRTLDGMKGRCYKLEEGYYCTDAGQAELNKHLGADPAKSKMMGYDDELSHGISTIMFKYITVLVGRGEKDDAKANMGKIDMLSSVSQNKFMIDSWKRVTKQKLAGDTLTIANVITANIDKPMNEVRKTLEGLGADHPFKKNHTAFALLMQDWLTFLADDAAKIHSKKHFVPENISELMKDFVTLKKPFLVLEVLAVEWRNLFLAQNIAIQYCKAILDGLNVFVSMGDKHEGVPDLLNASAGIELPIEKADTAEEMKKIYQMADQVKKNYGLDVPKR